MSQDFPKLTENYNFLSRFDIANPRRHFIIRALTLQNGTISVVIYLAALVLSLANAGIEDKIHLYYIEPMLWNNTAVRFNFLSLASMAVGI